MEEVMAETNELEEKSQVDSEDEEVSAKDNEPSFDRELRAFIAQITSLAVTIDISMEAINSAFDSTLDTLKLFEKDNIVFKEINGKKSLLVKTESAQRFEELNKQLRAYGLAYKTIPRSHIMSLVSAYDAFLGRLLRASVTS